MPYYRSVGEIPRKRHTQFRRPDGGLYAEELMGQEGFSTDSALLYHRHAPTAIVVGRGVQTPPASDRWSPTCRSSRGTCAPTSWTPAGGRRRCSAGATCSANDDVRHLVRGRRRRRRRSTATPSATSCLYVESGPARVETIFGALEVGAGDYVVLPTSTTHRLVPGGGEPLRLLVVEAPGTSGAPAALPVDARAVPRARAVLRA